jgi:hypothetical protein
LTYGQYSGRYNEAQIAANSPVGNPADIFTVYSGPAGQGRSFAPGFDIKNYPVDSHTSATVPTANVFMDPGLSSPLTHEFTASYGANLARGKGYAEAAYVFRHTGDLVEDFQTIAGGFTDVVAFGVDAGRVTNIIYDNTNDLFREYQGLVFQSRYRLTNRWSVQGHYTIQLENDGNYEGEGTSPPEDSLSSATIQKPLTKRAISPKVTCRTSSGITFGCGACTTSGSAAPATSRCPASGDTIRV